jgi:hypothetical protein
MKLFRCELRAKVPAWLLLLPLWIGGLGLLAWSPGAGGGQDCDAALMVKVAKNLSVANYSASDCRAMPDDPARTIVLDDDTILVVDSGDGHILARGDVALDGPHDSLILDLGRYHLNATTRAIGVRPHYETSKALDGTDTEAIEGAEWLYLYVVEGAQIRPVLTGQEMLVYFKWCGDGGACTQKVTGYKEESTLSVAKTSHNGYVDLLVVTKTTCDPGGCGTREPLKTERNYQLLKYDGKSYQ